MPLSELRKMQETGEIKAYVHTKVIKYFSSKAPKPINIRGIGTGIKKSCITSYYRQFSTNIKIKIMKS